MTAITTRPATKADASEIALLVNIAVHGGFARGWAHDERAEDTYDPIEVGRLDMVRDDTEFGWTSATMAEIGGEVAGMLLGYREPDEGIEVLEDGPLFMRPINELEAAAAGTWFVSMLGVHKTWRGKGIGSTLLDVAEQKCRDTRASGVALIVEDANEGAQRLYSRRGFAVRDRRPMVRYPDGSAPGKDWLLMTKD